MKRYKCHKEVEAAKIMGVMWSEIDRLYTLSFEDGWVINVAESWHPDPENIDVFGGYYVLYEDGYESWSPAEAFESRYTEI